jgi:hypothetical protein
MAEMWYDGSGTYEVPSGRRWVYSGEEASRKKFSNLRKFHKVEVRKIGREKLQGR